MRLLALFLAITISLNLGCTQSTETSTPEQLSNETTSENQGSQEKEDPTWVDQYVKPYVLPLHGYSDDNGPRVYKLPYSRELHEQSMGIRGFLMEGGVYRGSMRGDGLPGEGGQGNGQGNGQGRDGRGEGRPGGRGGSLSQEQVPHFYQLPPPKFPPKNEFGRQR